MDAVFVHTPEECPFVMSSTWHERSIFPVVEDRFRSSELKVDLVELLLISRGCWVRECRDDALIVRVVCDDAVVGFVVPSTSIFRCHRWFLFGDGSGEQFACRGLVDWVFPFGVVVVAPDRVFGIPVVIGDGFGFG